MASKREPQGDDGRLTMTIEEAGRALGVSRMSAYGAANRGEIPTIRIGRRLFVPKAAFQRLLDAAAAKAS